MEQIIRVRLHKVKIVKAEIFSGRLFTLGQDHLLCEYDLARSEKKLAVDLKTGAVDMDLNLREDMVAVSKLNGAVAFYSTIDGRQLPLGIELSERAESLATAIAWANPSQLVVGMEDGALLLYDIRKPTHPTNELSVESKINKILVLDNSKRLVLSSRLDFFDPYMRLEDSLHIDSSGSSLSAAYEDQVRRAVIVAGFDQKLHVIKLKSSL